jgi:hypothetical protein
MNAGRFSLMLIEVILVNALLVGTSFAGFWFGSDDTGKSGLDFSRGYDINTVTVVTGRVASLPQPGEQGQIVTEVRSGSETITVSLGPRTFWEKQQLQLRVNDEVTVKGSKAQGKDGKTYLLAQRVANRTTSTQVDLRDDKGVPAWLGGNRGGSMSDRIDGGMSRGGSMMRGGGGGMMRH